MLQCFVMTILIHLELKLYDINKYLIKCFIFLNFIIKSLFSSLLVVL